MSGAAGLLSIALATGTVEPVSSAVVDVRVHNEEGQRRSAMEQQFRDEIAAALGDAGITVVDEAARGYVLVDIRQPDIIDYEVTFRVELDGAVVAPGVGSFSCDSCRVVALQGRIVERVPQLVDALELPSDPVLEDEPRSSTEEDEEPSEQEQSPVPSTDDEPRARTRWLGSLGYAGIAVAALGVGGLTYGAVLTSRDPRTTANSDDESLARRESFERRGRVWLGVGIGSVLAGATMVVVDLTVLRRRRQQRVAVYPWGGPRWAGAAARLRF